MRICEKGIRPETVRALALALWTATALWLLLGIFATGAEAANGNFGGGTGTADDPYLIEDVRDLQAMKNDLTAHYALVNDIDADDTKEWNDGTGFVPVGEFDQRFTGSFEGRNHTISGLYIFRPSTDYVGLFGCMGSSASVNDVGFVDADITGQFRTGALAGMNDGGSVLNCYIKGNVSGDNQVGGLIGRMGEDAVVSDCYVMGNVSGATHIGGLVGRNDGWVKNSYATATVTGTARVGGLAGTSWFGVTERSYATGNVMGTERVGGFIGYIWEDAWVKNCYGTGIVTRSSGASTYFGGFIGYNYRGKVTTCYSIGSIHYTGTADPSTRGFCGRADPGGNYQMTGNYWDRETSGQTSTSGGATGKTTAEMMTRSTFMNDGWDFDDVWWMIDNLTYPLLKSQGQFDMWFVDRNAPDEGDGSINHPFNRIQDAVDTAADRDMIHVFAGVYEENIVVNKSVRIIGKGSVIIENGRGQLPVIYMTSGSIYLTNLYIVNGNGTGVLIDTNDVQMEYCSITGEHDGITVVNGSRNLGIHHSNIFANSGYGINASENHEAPVNAINNWWGHPSGPYLPTLNPGGRGIKVSDNVVIDPWLALPFDQRMHHVSPSGNDTRGAGDEDNPYRTFQRALEVTRDWDDIMVRGGVYHESITIDRQNIMIFGEPGGGTVLDARGAGEAIMISADDITIMDIEVRNASESGISIINSSGITITDCAISGNALDINLTNARDITLINTTFESVGFSDPNSTLSVLWYMDLKVTDRRSGFIPDARVRITDRFGTVVFDDPTDDRGGSPQMLLPGSGRNLTSTTRYDPYTIRVWRDGYLNFTEEVDITSYTRITCVMEEHILPVARITGDFVRYVDMDSEISLDGTGSTGRSITCSWDLGDGNTSTSPAPSHTYTVPGVYRVTLTVSDEYGNTATASVAIIVENVPSVAWGRTSTTTAFEDEPIEFDASGSGGKPSVTLAYLWDFGDGTRSNDMVTTHSFAKAGIYEVALTVTDRYGGTDTDTLHVTILNVAPWNVSAVVSGQLHPGKVLTFRGFAEDTPSDMAGLRYSWDFGDGTVTDGRNVTHVYSRAGTYEVTLTVTDDDGATDRTTLEVTIAVPMIEARVSSRLILQDGTVSFNASHELDNGTFIYVWHFGDGSSAGGRNVSHIYTRSGVFTPWLVISHGGGEENTTVFLGAITVENVVPDPVIHVDTLRVNQDELVTFDASGTTDSPSDLPSLNFIWDFGDGAGGGGITVTHAFRSAGTYQVTLHVSDGKVTNTSRVTMEVVNVPPTANARPDRERQATVGEPVILDGTASTDTPSDIPGLNFTWIIGDDTLYGKVVRYTFYNPGTYNVTLRVRDDDGAVSEDTITFRVEKGKEAGEKGMMTGFVWLLLVVAAVLLLVLGLALSGKGFASPVEIGELAEEIVPEDGTMIMHPEIDNSMFKPPGEVVPEAITEEKEPEAMDGKPTAGEIEVGIGEGGEAGGSGKGTGTWGGTPEGPDGPGEGKT